MFGVNICNIDEAKKIATRFDALARSQASAKTKMSGTGLFRLFLGDIRISRGALKLLLLISLSSFEFESSYDSNAG